MILMLTVITEKQFSTLIENFLREEINLKVHKKNVSVHYKIHIYDDAIKYVHILCHLQTCSSQVEHSIRCVWSCHAMNEETATPHFINGRCKKKTNLCRRRQTFRALISVQFSLFEKCLF